MAEYDRVVAHEAPFTVRMVPGQEPYTLEEWARVKRLVHDAALGDPGEEDEFLVLKQEKKAR